MWLVVDQATEVGFDRRHGQPGVVGGASLAWCVGVLVLGLRAPVTPRFAQLGLLIVIGFLLVNKVYSPQYVLWLLPLAALARPRWRDQLVWQGGELFYFAIVWWYLGGYLDPAGGGDAGFYWVAIVVRVAAELLPRRGGGARRAATRARPGVGGAREPLQSYPAFASWERGFHSPGAGYDRNGRAPDDVS